jgi:nitrate/nitrite transporter NarK
MLLPVLLCTMLSADEVARVHEWIGRKADHALLPGGSRYTTPLLRSGIWMFLLVPPVAFAAWIGARAVFRFYAGAHASRVRAVVGWVGFFGAAGGLELLANLTVGNEHLSVLQVLAEESGEMLAVTVICWSQVELLRGASARIAFEAPVGREPEPESIRPVGVV